MENMLPPISEQDRQTISSFVNSKSEASVVLKKIFEMYLEHFRDIRHIDVHDNVGLQTCSHLRAYDMMQEILDVLNVDDLNKLKTKSNSFR